MKEYIVAVGYAGALYAAKTAAEHEKELRERFRSSFIEEILDPGYGRCGATGTGGNAPSKRESTGAVDACTAQVHAGEGDRLSQVHVTEGGFLAEVYQLAVSRRCGVRIRIKSIPLLQSTVEVCELYGINPFRAETEGCLLVSGDGYGLAAALTEAGIPAACIGFLAEGFDKLIIDKPNPEYINKK